MKLKQLLAATVLSAVSVCSFATPIYTGDTDASGFSNAQLNTGYTIWNGEGANASDWHVRWTSKNANNGTNVSWFGSIVFYNSLLDSTNTTVYQWESGQDSLSSIQDSPFLAGGDAIAWTALTNDSGGVDGFNFSLLDGIELLEFKLGSSLFSDLELDQTNAGTDATMITIGDQADRLKVNVAKNQQGTYQHVQVSVPEPASLALLGLGLAGLGFARRKQAKA